MFGSKPTPSRSWPFRLRRGSAASAKRVRNPVLRRLGDADQAVLRTLRTRAHDPVTESAMKGLGTIGEYGAAWAAIGAAGALVDNDRRPHWAAAALVAPAAILVNYAVKRGVGRERPLIEGHPPLARAPSKLSFPSAHATSSAAAARALGRVEPRARTPLFALAAGICLSRPYLGMHYPSDVLAGALLGLALGSLFPAPHVPGTEERLVELAGETHAARA